MKSRKSLYIWLASLSVLLLLVIPHALYLLKVVFFHPYINVWSQLELFLWVSVGCIVYLLVYKYLPKNIQWLENHTHENIHALVAMLLMRKVHSIQADEREGVVCTSGHRGITLILTSLAPYHLPVYTYGLLMLRPLINFEGRWIFDVLVGITLCFHLICFIKQTRKDQPDINQYPLVFSYLYIITAHVMNFCIIWCAFFPQYNVFTSFWRMVCAMWGQVLSIF